MSTISLANLQRISAKDLSEILLTQQAAATDPTVAVVDVRDDDYIGGHIKGGINMPSATLDVMMPTLVRRMQGKKTVVFHCALSQQRGPSAALKYLRERDQMMRRENPAELANQTVYVLDLGFSGWQQTYGEDERLTDGYSKELWQSGF
ncbi:CDC25-like phosphatase YCH1 [Verticillium longisporum]|uniref:CDC25-like phosphatase YCH1 n=2 Tax=Verticillium longisporum TaxID=100787 RepID=A0A8I2ZPY5_VERLO|nr:CDC25-like phosphatase YCH1 [Verticillium longisporum]KAG7136150.1 CDC25-like phosphatase YCH1 [Verticillium longisporum]